jgi:hypothetical protein
MSDKPPNNCTTLIARKLTLQEMALQSNMQPRPVEQGYDKHLGRVHRIKQIWILESESPNYLRIADADREWDKACMRGEYHLYGRARWRQIAHDLDIPYEEVAYQLRK